jgi:Rieske Fe-S protein
MTDSTPNAPAEGCAGCPVGTRREFLMDALRASAVALAAIGFSAERASAMPLRFVAAIASSGEEHSYPIPATDGVQIDKANEVILARTGKSVYAFALSCPHQNTALRWDAAANRFQCPKHKSRYQPDGTFIEGRATRSMDRYAVKLVGTNVVVDIDKLYQEDTDNALWQHAVVALP